MPRRRFLSMAPLTGTAGPVGGQFRPARGISVGGEGGAGRWLMAALAFVVPLFLWVDASVLSQGLGRIFLSELVLIALLPLLLMKRGRMLLQPLPRTFLLLALAWLFAQVLTDLIRDTPFVDYSRGWSKIAFTTLNFSSLYMLLYGSRKRMVLFALGLVFGGYLGFMLAPSDFALGHPWKFGVGIPTTLLVVLLAQWRPIYRVWFLPVVIVFAIGIVSLYVGSRSLAGITILTALYILVQQFVGRRRIRPLGLSPRRALLFLLFGLAVTSAVVSFYDFAATQGLLGERARELYESQGSGAFGVLLGGRSEIIVSSYAIMDSPIIGHGSWAKDPFYSSLRLAALARYGYLINFTASETDLIPTHSHLFGAWVEAGIAGAVFWFWVLFLTFRVMSNLFVVREPLAPLIAFIGFVMLWDVLFSPFGAERRITVPYNLIVLMFAWDILRASPLRKRIMRGRRMQTPDASPREATPR